MTKETKEKLTSEKLEQLTNKVKDMQSEINELNGISSPTWLNEQMSTVIAKVDNLASEVTVIKVDFQRLKEEKLVEIVTDSELKKLWDMSGVPLKVIAEEMKFEMSTASKLINGGIKNLHDRHRLKQYLLRKIKEKDKVAV